MLCLRIYFHEMRIYFKCELYHMMSGVNLYVMNLNFSDEFIVRAELNE